MSLTHHCPCGAETEVTVYPVVRGRYFGPPEQCYPDEGGFIEPDECEDCGRKIPNDEMQELWAEYERDAAEVKAERAYEAWREREEMRRTQI